jgi:hypothetical protein
VTRAYDHTVELDVLLQAKPGSGGRNLVYGAAVVQSGGRFLVDSFFPETTLGAEPAAEPKTKEGQPAEAAPRFSQRKLSGRWLLVPVGVLSLLLVVPILLVARGLLRSRRAERLHRERSGS